MFKDVIPDKNGDWRYFFYDLAQGGIDDFLDQHKIADENFKEFLEHIGNAKFDMQDYEQWLIKSGKATSRFSSFSQKAGAVLKGFGASLASMGVNMAIGMALDFAITKFTEWENKEESAAQKAQAFTESINKIQSSVSENSNKVSELSSRYEELSKGVSKGVIDKLIRSISNFFATVITNQIGLICKKSC